MHSSFLLPFTAHATSIPTSPHAPRDLSVSTTRTRHPHRPYRHHCHQCSAPTLQTPTWNCFAARHLLASSSSVAVCHPRSFALACLPGGGLPLCSPTAPALCSQLPPVQPAPVLSTRAILTARTSTITHPNPASLPKHSPALPDHTRPLKVEQRSPLLIFSRRFTQCHNATKLGKRGSTTASPASKVHRRLSLGALRSPCATRPPCNHARAFFQRRTRGTQRS